MANNRQQTTSISPNTALLANISEPLSSSRQTIGKRRPTKKTERYETLLQGDAALVFLAFAALELWCSLQCHFVQCLSGCIPTLDSQQPPQPQPQQHCSGWRSFHSTVQPFSETQKTLSVCWVLISPSLYTEQEWRSIPTTTTSSKRAFQESRQCFQFSSQSKQDGPIHKAGI